MRVAGRVAVRVAVRVRATKVERMKPSSVLIWVNVLHKFVRNVASTVRVLQSALRLRGVKISRTDTSYHGCPTVTPK